MPAGGGRREAKVSSLGFGALLRRGIEDLRHVAALREAPFTELLEYVADKSGVSERTLWRWLDSAEWPTQAGLDRIGQCLPKLERALDCSYTYRADWQTVSLDQQRLPLRSTLTIASAAEKPKSLDEQGFALTLANNILTRGFRYIFLYPPFPDDDLEGIKDAVVFTSVAAYKRSGPGHAQLRGAVAHDRVSASLRFVRTTREDRSWEFWGRSPRYMVLYNVRARPADAFPRFGMFWDEGVSAVSYSDDDSESISGWTNLTRTDCDAMYRLLEDRNSGVLSKKDYGAWLIPGGS